MKTSRNYSKRGAYCNMLLIFKARAHRIYRNKLNITLTD